MSVRFPRSLIVVISQLVVLILLLHAGSLPSTVHLAPASAAGIIQPETSQALRANPILFIENAGQFADGARFQVRGGNGTLWLAEDALWITVIERSADVARSPVGISERFDPKQVNGEGDHAPRAAVNLKLSFPGANPHPRLEPFDRLDTHVSYFLGNDPAQWRPDVPVWGGVRYVDLYPGIDLEVTGADGRVTQRLVASQGVDQSIVTMRVDGGDHMELAGKRLRLQTEAGVLALPLPAASFDFRVVGSGLGEQLVTAEMTDTDSLPPAHSRQNGVVPLENPPELLYSTFLGGSSDDYGIGIAVDNAAATYVVGTTTSTDFPTTPGGFDLDPGVLCGTPPYTWICGDAFVVKLNPTGVPAYSTFLGGVGNDRGFDVTVDALGNAFVTGSTESSDFPVTANAYQAVRPSNGYYQTTPYVTKLNPTGTLLSYSTYLGGDNQPEFSDARGWGIAVDRQGNLYVVGDTPSDSGFPVTSGAFDTTSNGESDAFVAKLDPIGGGLVYATFLGGSGDDQGYAIVVNGLGNAHVVGETYSTDFPTTPGAFDRSHGDYSDAFVVKLNPAGSELAYATLLSGSSYDEGYAIAVDEAGSTHVTGETCSYDFPTTPGAFDTTLNGSYCDAFVVKLNPAGSGLAYATFLGGSDAEGGYGITVDGAGSAYVAGDTRSLVDFPLTDGALATAFGGGEWDGFVAKLSVSGSRLIYGTFLGGAGNDGASSIALNPAGDVVHVTGDTGSWDFPLTANAFDSTLNAIDAFVVKLHLREGPPVTPGPTRTPGNTPTSINTPTNTPTATPSPTPPLPVVLYPHTDGWLRGYPASQIGSASVSSSQRSAEWEYVLPGTMSGNTYKLLELSLNPLSSACSACLDFKFITKATIGGSELVLASTNRCVSGIGELFSRTLTGLDGGAANGPLFVFRMTWTSGTCPGVFAFGSPTFSRIEIPGVLPQTPTPTVTPTVTATPTRTPTATPRARVYLPLLRRNP